MRKGAAIDAAPFFSTGYWLSPGLLPRPEAERSSAGTPVRRCSRPVWEMPFSLSLLLAAVRSFVSVEEAPAPIAVLVSPRPAVAPPAPTVEEVPEFDPLRVEEAPVPRAVLVEPFPAVAPPTPRLDDVPAFDP
jgi:hypothetical protein